MNEFFPIRFSMEKKKFKVSFKNVKCEFHRKKYKDRFMYTYITYTIKMGEKKLCWGRKVLEMSAIAMFMNVS